MMPMLFPGMANPVVGGAAATEQMQELMKKQLELMSQLQQSGQVCVCVCARACVCVCVCMRVTVCVVLSTNGAFGVRRCGSDKVPKYC